MNTAGGDTSPPYPLTGDTVASFVTGGSLTKVVSCTFHAALPWVALTPKHGTTAAVWDYKANTLVGTIDVLVLLSAQLSAVVPSGEWTPSLCGTPFDALFLDGPHLRWTYEHNRSQRYDPAAPTQVAAAGLTPIPSPLYAPPQMSAGHLRRQLSLGGSLASGGSFTTGRGGDSANGASGAGAHDAMRVGVITNTMAIIVDLATSTVTHALTPTQIQNRELVSARLVVVETASRYQYTYEALHGPSGGLLATLPSGLTPGMLDDVVAEIVLGCADGTILVWTITPPPTRAGQLVSDARLPPRSDILRVIKTGHSSAIMNIHQFAFVNTTNFKPSVPEDPKPEGDDDGDDDGGADDDAQVALFATRTRASFVSFVYCTKGGSVGHIALGGAPESFIQQSTANDPNAEKQLAAGIPPPKPGPGTTTFLWARKNVHSRVVSLAVSLMPPSILFSASTKSYVCDSTTPDELCTNVCTLKSIYALGEDALTIHHGRNGSELRRLEFNNNLLPSPPVSVFATHFHLHIVCDSDDHMLMGLDMTTESVRPWLRLSALIPITTPQQRQARISGRAPFGRHTSAPAIQAPNPDDDEGFEPSDANVRVYRGIQDPSHPNGQVALLTNEGCVVVEAGLASPVECARGVAQSQLVFPLPPPSVQGGADEAARLKAQRRKGGRRSGGNNGSGAAGDADKSAVAFLILGAKYRLQAVTLQDSLFAADDLSGKHGGPSSASSPSAAPRGGGKGGAPMAAIGTSGTGYETRLNGAPHYSLRMMHEFSVGPKDSGSEAMPPRASADDASRITLRTVLEPSPTFNVRSVHVTNQADLVAVVTDTRELLVFDMTPTGGPLIVPPNVKQAHPDVAAWAFNGLHIALLNVDTHTITIGALEHRAGRYAFHPQPHTIQTSNVPRGITGGRWLCVHYEPTFSGLTSQFYRWESSSRGGGGALGGFIPQPRELLWDRTSTMCALVYESTITFMHAHRKLFSVLCTTEVRSVPLHAMFVRRALIVVLHREIVMLLPTTSGVHKVVLASSSASQASGNGPSGSRSGGTAGGGVSGGATGATRAGASGLTAAGANGIANLSAASFDAVVHVRPPGNLFVANFDEANFDLYIVDELTRVVRLPLAGSIAHLLWVLHAAPYTSDAPTAAEVSAAAARAHVMSTSAEGSGLSIPTPANNIASIVAWQTAYTMLQSFLQVHVSGSTSMLLVEAVEDFARACGCGALLAHLKGVDALDGSESPVSPQSPGTGSVAETRATLDHVATAVLAAMEPQLGCAMVVIHQVAGDATRPIQQRKAQLAELRRVLRERVVRETVGCTADGWALSDGRVPEQLAEALLARVHAMRKRASSTGEAGAAVADDPLQWQADFLESMAQELLEHRFN